MTRLFSLLPLVLAGVMGIAWAFAALWLHVHAGPRGIPLTRRVPPPPAPVPRDRRVPFSLTALLGALFSAGSIPFGAVAFVIVKAIVHPSIESGSQLNGPPAGNVILFGFIPAMIGMALGWKAVGDLRYHRGYLRGGGTAVFAAVGIPIFAAVVTALANFRDISDAISPSRRNSEGVIVALLTVLAAISGSIWAVRALWRAVHEGPPGVPVQKL